MTEPAAPIAELRDWFEDEEKQQHAGRLGMWLFLTSELLLFGALFGLYVAYRTVYGAEFMEAAHHNEVAIGTINTLVLITSSFTVAWSIHAIRLGRRTTTLACLLATVGLGVLFLVLKGFEYSHHFQEGILPGLHYRFAELPGDGAKLFFTLYYFMTGLHALHVVGGLTALSVVAVMVWQRKVRHDYYIHLENSGLYWHLVDVIWIFLWPLLYLVG